MKKYIKQLTAVVISLAVFFSLIPGSAVIKAEEEVKTTFPVYTLHKSGSDRENFVIVIMGDGYTASQREQFVEDATKKAQGMLTWSPYKEYSDRINIYGIPAVSNESGISVYGGKSVDTYFHIRVWGKAAVFSDDGAELAKALRQELEENYLDAGATVGTIHMLSNADGSYGASINSLFSFSANSDENSNGTAMAHEIAHSIGGLGDEYERYTNKPNTSDTTDPDTIKWSKLLGFRGVGITMAGTETAFAPSRECMMRWLGQPFCEVCKMELARKLNNTDYVSQPVPLYVADPEITIPHSKTGTLDKDSEKYRISKKNITKANQQDLEFRTVVQNMVNQEQHLKIRLRIVAADGTTVKYEKEQDYTIPALSNYYDPDAARESLSVVIQDVTDLVKGDTLDGEIIDTDTGKVLATDKTAEQSWSTVNLHYELKKQDGTTETVPRTAVSTVYVPKNSTYSLRNPALSGYTFAGSSEDTDEIKVTEDSKDITYYYEEKKNSPEETEAPTATPTITPTAAPTATPTITPTAAPTATPTITPTAAPTATSTITPTAALTATPTITPTAAPTATPTITPTAPPTVSPKDTPALPTKPNITPQPTNLSVPAAHIPAQAAIRKTFKIKRATIRSVLKKKGKKLRYNSNGVRITLDQKTLKEIRKRTKSTVYLTLESTERPVLSAKAKKIVGSRPVYKLSMKDKTGKKITWLKKGKVIIEVRYKPSKTEKKKRYVTCRISHKGNVKKIANAHNNIKTKRIKIKTNHLYSFAVGYKA